MIIDIYTDGGAVPNPGRGGWAAIFVVDGIVKKKLSGACDHTTNNAMEITACLRALQEFKRPSEFTIYSDSQYVIKSITEWIPARGTRGKKNAELFEMLIERAEPHKISWQWVRAHNGNEFNELADELAGERIFDGALCPGCNQPLTIAASVFDWVQRTITCDDCGEIFSMGEIAGI